MERAQNAILAMLGTYTAIVIITLLLCLGAYIAYRWQGRRGR
ncbi:hypothetical protein ACLI1A_10365 [Flavobacterium sp. RHBU_3]